MSPVAIFGVVFPIVVLIVSIVVLVALRKKETSNREELLRSGVTVEGSVLERQEATSGGRYGRPFGLTYSYVYGGSPYSGKEADYYFSTLLTRMYRDVKAGDNIQVRCLPEHPGIARLELALVEWDKEKSTGEPFEH